MSSLINGGPMIIEVSVAVAVFIFAVIAVFLIRALINLNKALIALRESLSGTEKRLQSFDACLNAFSDVGEICKNQTDKLKRYYLAKSEFEDRRDSYSPDITGLLVSSVNLFDKLFRRK